MNGARSTRSDAIAAWHQPAVWLCFSVVSLAGCGASSTASSGRVASLRAEIETRATGLDYPRETAALIRDMVSCRPDVLTSLCLQSEFILNRTEAGQRQQVVAAEKVLAEKIVALIHDEVSPDETSFDLGDVARRRRANCLGGTQLFYLLGRSAGLSVTPAGVLEFQKPSWYPAGSRHACCLVTLSDHSVILVNPAPRFFVSRPFAFNEVYVRSGNYYKLRDPDNPLRLYRKIQLLDERGLAAHVCNSRGAALMAQDRLHEALEQYGEATALNPLFAEAWNNQAIALSRSGDPNGALLSYNRAIEIDGDYVEAYYNRANTYSRLGEYDRAIEDYSEAIRQSPRMDQAYANRALCYTSLGQRDAAKRDLARAAELNPMRFMGAHLAGLFDQIRPKPRVDHATAK
jgi:Tfp pilus assembly protein PilF